MSNFKKYILTVSFIFPCAAGFALLWLLKANPELAEAYSSQVFPVLSYPFAKFSSLFGFSLTELLVLALPFLLLCALICFIAAMVRSKRKRHVLKRAFQIVGWLLSVSALMLTLFHGCNYYRQPLQEKIKLDISEKSASDVRRVCALLANEANIERALLNSDENGNMILTETIADTFSHAGMGFGVVRENICPLPDVPSVPKSVVNSHYWSYTGIVGMYFPLTMEANINTDVPHWTIPYAACHELSHTLGYAREDDAGFLAFLSCTNHPSSDYRYSGYLNAFLECVDALRGYDVGMWEEAWSYLSEDVYRDIRQNAVYWKSFEGKTREVSTAVNDAFLKANGQSEGVLQYSHTAELILSYYS